MVNRKASPRRPPRTWLRPYHLAAARHPGSAKSPRPLQPHADCLQTLTLDPPPCVSCQKYYPVEKPAPRRADGSPGGAGPQQLAKHLAPAGQPSKLTTRCARPSSKSSRSTNTSAAGSRSSEAASCAAASPWPPGRAPPTRSSSRSTCTAPTTPKSSTPSSATASSAARPPHNAAASLRPAE